MMKSQHRTPLRGDASAWAFSRRVFTEGMRDGVPIALGYFAVSFSLGIAARHAGFTPLQGFLASLFNNASAGEYAAFSLIASGATLRALTTRSGKRLPAIMPSVVPIAQAGAAIEMAP